MHVLLAETLSHGTIMLLAILGCGTFIFLMTWGINVFSRKMSGWPEITAKFPMKDGIENGDAYDRQSGLAGNIECNRGFNVHLTSQGVCIFPTFARRNPCLIPWPAIKHVAVSDKSLLVTVDHEKAFQFFLPPSALPNLQSKISAERFQKATSVFTSARTSLKENQASGLTSRIAGKAIDMAGKEYEKEKQAREGRPNDAR